MGEDVIGRVDRRGVPTSGGARRGGDGDWHVYIFMLDIYLDVDVGGAAADSVAAVAVWEGLLGKGLR
jgi:hypothetical protein